MSSGHRVEGWSVRTCDIRTLALCAVNNYLGKRTSFNVILVLPNTSSSAAVGFIKMLPSV